MKRIFVLGVLMMLFNVLPVSAANGDAIQPIYSTDILTYIDGVPIKGYAIGGRMMICLEDLSNYGFSVHYDDEARCLFVNKQKNVKTDFSPTIERGKVGDIIGYTYETDIKAMVNGEEIYSENIGGRLAVTVEDLDNLNDTNLSGSISIKNYPKYFMMQSYNDFARVLNLYSDISFNTLYNSNIANFESDIKNKNVATEIVDKYVGEEFTQYIYRGAGRKTFANDESLTVVRFYNNGRIIDYTQTFYVYSFIGGNGLCTSLYDNETKPQFSNDGEYLIFNANRTEGRSSLMGSRDVFEAGIYRLNLNTCKLEKVNTENF